MKKALLSAFVIISFALYSWHARSEQNSVTVPAPTSLQQNNPATTTPSVHGTPSAIYKDGSYTGGAADAYYGNIQVQVSVSGGKITDVSFLQYPTDRGESVSINQQAMPYLKHEAIQAQSATIDGVSGATDTSQAFIESLTSALNQAKN